jgi:hypothetical protein
MNEESLTYVKAIDTAAKLNATYLQQVEKSRELREALLYRCFKDENRPAMSFVLNFIKALVKAEDSGLSEFQFESTTFNVRWGWLWIEFLAKIGYLHELKSRKAGKILKAKGIIV